MHGAEHTVIPDRIEAGRHWPARGDHWRRHRDQGARAETLECVRDKAGGDRRDCGTPGPNGTIRVKEQRPISKSRSILSLRCVSGFPTDMQAQMSALMTVTPGIRRHYRKVFPNRSCNQRDGRGSGRTSRWKRPSAIVKGREKTQRPPVMACDLTRERWLGTRGLAADGETEVNRIYHVDRGYDRIDQKLRLLGAKIGTRGGMKKLLILVLCGAAALLHVEVPGRHPASARKTGSAEVGPVRKH